MCRLFGMTGGPQRITATFWLLQAPDSLAEQSRREPDGTGLGAYDERDQPVVSKQPLAAYEDRDFATEAKDVHSRTFVAHVRYASNGGVELKNTHPFEQEGRLFAHNGVIGEVQRLDAELGPARSLVRGDTDSERYFALITRETQRCGALGEGIRGACEWLAANLPIFAINFVLITPTDLWALRYPDTHELHVLERAAGGPDGGAHLDHRGDPRETRVHSAHLAEHPSVVVASEPMDDDPGWRAMGSGELLHVDGSLRTTLTTILPDPPAHRLTLADLDPRAAASQRKSGQ
ncbi:MAG TPA: class II glutamine amidotransferase [Solirubrobacteraceae bacterium]|nr:class II glutamine amidotransferase [Solirubrobacteraceae bacterium]